MVRIRFPRRADALGPINGRETSTILRSLVEHTTNDEISLGEIIETLGGRGFGILLVLFGMLNMIPAPVPGLSTVLGMPLVFLSWQLASGTKRPWFPAKVAQRKITSVQLEHLAAAAQRFRPVERLFRPRLSGLVADRVLGALCLLLSFFIIMPIPLGNWPPAVGITFFGFAIAKRDGLAVILGGVAGAVAIGLIASVLFAAGHTINNIVN